MLAAKLHYLDCSIRVCNRQQRRAAPIFSGRIWFSGLSQFIEAVEQKLQPFVSTVDQLRICYRKRGGKYYSLHTSEQEFLDTCINSNIIISYFLHGPFPSLMKKNPTLTTQKVDSSSENIASIILNLKDTFPTWSGPNQSWIELARYYNEAGLTGIEVVDLPQNYRSLFTVEQEKAVSSVGVNTSAPPVVPELVSQPLDKDCASLSKEKAKTVNVATATLPVSMTETGTEIDANLSLQLEGQIPYSSLYVDNSHCDNIYQQCFSSQPASSAAPMERNHGLNASELGDTRAQKPEDQSDSLVHLTIPKVSAKAAYIITGVVYADIQAREGI